MERNTVRNDAPRGGEAMNSVARLLRTFLAILREVFDESAYKRFLQSSHIPSSPAAYATLA